MDERTAVWIEEKRGIPVEIAAEHGLVTIQGHPAFAYTDLAGELLYNKIRLTRKDGSKSFVRDRKGVPAVLFNLACLAEPLPNEDTPLIICEGEIDCLSWISAGATHVVSVPDGAQREEPGQGDIDPLQDTGYAWLWGDDGRLLPELRLFRRIIIATDDDKPGDVLAEELAVRLGVSRCWRLKSGYGGGCKDANEALLKLGVDHLVDLISDVVPMVPASIVSLADVPAVVERPSWEVGWQFLRKHLVLTCPELMVVTGEPGAGKSQWAFGLMLEMARLHRLNGFVLQFEDHPSRLITDAMAYAKVWSREYGNSTLHTGDDPEEWVRRRIYTMQPPAIGDDTPEMTLDWVKHQIEQAVYQKGCKLVILDPWNEIEHCWGANETETQYINRALRDLKGWARRLNICLIIVAHPGKAMANKPIEECTLYDVSGSAAWRNKADHGVILKRVMVDESNQESNTMVTIKVDKSKEWTTMGVPGTTVLEFDPRRRIYVRPS